MPLSDSLDHTGPITRTARDAALMLNVIAGYDPNDADLQPRARTRLHQPSSAETLQGECALA